MHILHSRPRACAKDAVNLSHIESPRLQLLLQRLHLPAAEPRLWRACIKDRCALQTVCKVGGRQHVGERLVPFEVHPEVRIGDEGRPFATLRDNDACWQVSGQLSVAPAHPEGGPLRCAHLRAQPCFGPIQIRWQHDLLQPWLSSPPTKVLKHFATRHKRIGRRAFQIHPSVAVSVDTIVENVLRQHLHHANLTGPGPRRALRVKVAFLEKLQRRKYLWTEELRAAAIMAQRHQRIQRVEIALKSAKIGFKGPKRQKHAAADAKLAFNTVKHV